MVPFCLNSFGCMERTQYIFCFAFRGIIHSPSQLPSISFPSMIRFLRFSRSKMKCTGEAVKINRRLLPLKFTYFFFLAGKLHFRIGNGLVYNYKTLFVCLFVCPPPPTSPPVCMHPFGIVLRRFRQFLNSGMDGGWSRNISNVCAKSSACGISYCSISSK